jgi:hypothetical protein
VKAVGGSRRLEEQVMTTYPIDRIQGQVMPVNSFLIGGPDGIVVIDGMLTISDARLVRRALA